MNINQLIKAFGSFGDKALVTISHAHNQLHQANLFTAYQRTAVDALDIAAPLTFWFIPATYNPHVIVRANLGAQGYLEIFEDDGNAAHFNVSAGNAFVPVNRNRVSTQASLMALRTGVTVTQATADVLIYAETMANLIGGGIEHEHEFILKAGTEYLFRLSTYADNNEGSLILNWYERRLGTR